MSDQLSSIESGGRARGKIVVKPIVFGNESKYFGKKRESDGHTHTWTIYVRPFDHTEDMSAYVKKVQFKLHESYAESVRTVTKPPFEVTETGWGEFEINIKIYFVDNSERPVTLYHLLKLFSNPLLKQQQCYYGAHGQLISEYYDEILFQDPSVYLHRQLTSGRAVNHPPYETDWRVREEDTVNSIQQAKKRVAEEIAHMKERLQKQKNAIQLMKDEIVKVEQQQDLKT